VTVRLADPLLGLSSMADLGFALPQGESLRACVLATALARRCDLPDEEVRAVYYTALLQHLGCTGFAHETAQRFGDELAVNAALSRTNLASMRDVVTTFLPALTSGHPVAVRARLALTALTAGSRFGAQFTAATCEVGRATARRLGLPEEVQHALYHVYEWWNGGGGPDRIKGEAIPLAARAASLAGVAALFDSIGGVEASVAAVAAQAGGVLDPDLADRYVRAAPDLLGELNDGDIRDLGLAAEPLPHVVISDRDLVDAAGAFGDLADLKTPFTHGHSQAVAVLAEGAGRRLGLADDEVRRLQLAASTHDLGRVAVPNAVWELPRPLGGAEWEQVRTHPYYSERILAGSRVLAPLARWAGMHHERLDGSGYHRGCGAAEQPMPVRVLAAADAFQAMTQPRPHRPAHSPDRAADLVREEGRTGRLDPDAVEAILTAAGHTPATGRRTARRPAPAGLSDREVEVLALMARGLANKQIAHHLVISRRTAEHHVQHIYTKIGVSSRAAAALFAMEHRLLGE
jgi:HD-GYP domain-containing protein (c-di-GMP phosphodiesterase class II)